MTERETDLPCTDEELNCVVTRGNLFATSSSSDSTIWVGKINKQEN